MKDILYTPEELSKLLKLSKYTIYEMIKRGDIPAHHIGRSIRISQQQLETYFIKNQKSENIYTGEAIHQKDLSYILVNGIKIYISTPLTGAIKISIPPEDIILSKTPFESSARNMLKGSVSDIVLDEKKAKVMLNLGFPMASLITLRSLEEMEIKKGMILYAVFKTMAVRVVRG